MALATNMRKKYSSIYKQIFGCVHTSCLPVWSGVKVCTNSSERKVKICIQLNKILLKAGKTRNSDVNIDLRKNDLFQSIPVFTLTLLYSKYSQHHPFILTLASLSIFYHLHSLLSLFLQKVPFFRLRWPKHSRTPLRTLHTICLHTILIYYFILDSISHSDTCNTQSFYLI